MKLSGVPLHTVKSDVIFCDLNSDKKFPQIAQPLEIYRLEPGSTEKVVSSFGMLFDDFE